ncbi:hypothetical protein OROMI_017431 [Orobanche minor]
MSSSSLLLSPGKLSFMMKPNWTWPRYVFVEDVRVNVLLGPRITQGGGFITAEIAWYTKCGFFQWKDDELEDGYYRNLILELRAKVNQSVDVVEYNRCRMDVAELQNLLLKEKTEAEKLEKMLAASTNLVQREACK